MRPISNDDNRLISENIIDDQGRPRRVSTISIIGQQSAAVLHVDLTNMNFLRLHQDIFSLAFQTLTEEEFLSFVQNFARQIINFASANFPNSFSDIQENNQQNLPQPRL